MSIVEVCMALAFGVALAAAVGLRVFLPLLVVAVAARLGFIPLAESFSWLASPVALGMLAVAAVAEMAAYSLPGVDNLLDTLAAPLALVAGTLVVAAPLAELPGWMQWSAAVVAGGGPAGSVQGVTSLLRAKSTVTTGGLANPVVATGEWGGALLLSLLAVAVPVLAVVLAALGLLLVYRLVRRLVRPSPR